MVVRGGCRRSARAPWPSPPQRDSAAAALGFGRWGQSLLIAPPKHPFWLGLIGHLVARYDRRCYAPSNTGPDAVTNYVNQHICVAQTDEADGLRIEDGFMRGPVTKHHGTGSWRKHGVASGMAARGNHFGRCPRPGFAALDGRCTFLRRSSF